MEQKFPDGKWKITKSVNSFLSEQDLSKKEEMFDHISNKIKTDSDWAYLKPSLPFFTSSIPNAYYQKQDWDGMQAAIKKYDVKGTQLAFLNNNAAWQIQQTNKN